MNARLTAIYFLTVAILKMKSLYIKHRKYLILLFLVLLIVFVRMTVLMNTPEAFYNVEGLFRGSVALEMIKGLKHNIFAYKYTNYEGGSLMVGLLAVPLFIILGDRFVSLMTVSLLFAVGSLIVLYLFTYKYFGEFVAIITGLFFIFLPRFFLQFSFIPLGNHPESALFSLLITAIFYKLFFQGGILYQNPQERNKALFLIACFGVISGLATFCCYTFFIAFFTLCLFWYIFDKGFFFKKEGMILIVSFLIGFSPWMLDALFQDGRNIINIYEKSIFEYFSLKNISTAIVTFGGFLCGSLKDVISVTYGNYKGPYYVLIISLAGVFAMNVKHILRLPLAMVPFVKKFSITPKDINKETIILLYVIIFLFAYHLFGMNLQGVPDYRPSYLIAGYPFVLLLVGCFIKTLCYSKPNEHYKMRMVGAFFLVYFIGAGSYEYLSCLSPLNINNFNKVFQYKGHSIRVFNPVINERGTVFLKDASVAKDFISGRITTNYFKNNFGYGYLGINGFDYTDRLKEEIRLMRNFDKRLHPSLYVWIGMGIGDRFSDDADVCIDLVNRHIDDFYRHYVYEGMALSVQNQNRINGRSANPDFINKIPQEYRHYFFNALGFFSMRDSKDKAMGLIRTSDSFGRMDRRYLLAGIMDGINRGSLKDFLNNEFKGLIPLDAEPYLYRSIGRRYHSEDLTAEIDKGRIDSNEFFLQGMGEGLIYDTLDYYISKDIFSLLRPSLINDIMNNALKTAELYPPERAVFIYQGIGRCIAFITFGCLEDWNFSEEAVPEDYLKFFYYGFGEGVRLRYGSDLKEIDSVIYNNVDEEKREYRSIKK